MLEIKYWGQQDWDSDGKHLLIKDRNNSALLKKMFARMTEKVPSINTIEIETINRCNNDCSFCPVSRQNDIRVPNRMSEELFYRIIDQLKEEKYDGYISLFSNNEPLLDVRIFEFLKYAKESLPNAKHAMYTNGILLTKEKYMKLVKYLDYLVIDNYADDFALYENIREIVEDTSVSEGDCSVRIEVRKKTQVLSNRGALAPNKHSSNSFVSPCVLPFFQMVVRPDGKVSRCCQDAYGNMTCSDLAVESIKEAWNSKAYQTMRNRMALDGRKNIKQCQNCDLFGLNNYFPIEWVHEYTEAFLDIVKEQGKRYSKLIICGDSYNGEVLAQLLSFHGIYADVIEEELTQVEEDSLYICTCYDWDILALFDEEDIGNRIIVFENPIYSLLQNKEAERSYDNWKTVLQEIRVAEEEHKLVLFGAGNQGRELLKRYRWNVQYFIDNNEQREGEVCENIKICHPHKLLEDKEAVIVITCRDYKSVKKQLLEMGINRERILNGNILL